MAEWSANAVQTVNPGEAVIFTETPVPPVTNLVRHRDDTGSFLLSGVSMRPYSGCACNRPKSTTYRVSFNANIAIPTAGVYLVECWIQIGIATQIDGTTVPTSSAVVTPAAVEEFFNVGSDVDAQIWLGCCESVSVINNSATPILVRNANLIIER